MRDRYSIVAWNAEGTSVGEASARSLRSAHSRAPEVVRFAFSVGKVPARVTISDFGNGGILVSSREVERVPLACQDPEHVNPMHGQRRPRRR